MAMLWSVGGAEKERMNPGQFWVSERLSTEFSKKSMAFWNQLFLYFSGWIISVNIYPTYASLLDSF